MCGEKKEYMRSVRMTKTVQDYVESQPDTENKGFNQKFENMVLFCKKEKPRLEAEIADAEERLKKLLKRCADAEKILRSIDDMKWDLQKSIKAAEGIAKGCGVTKEKNSPES